MLTSRQALYSCARPSVFLIASSLFDSPVLYARHSHLIREILPCWPARHASLADCQAGATRLGTSYIALYLRRQDNRDSYLKSGLAPWIVEVTRSAISVVFTRFELISTTKPRYGSCEPHFLATVASKTPRHGDADCCTASSTCRYLSQCIRALVTHLMP